MRITRMCVRLVRCTSNGMGSISHVWQTQTKCFNSMWISFSPPHSRNLSSKIHTQFGVVFRTAPISWTIDNNGLVDYAAMEPSDRIGSVIYFPTSDSNRHECDECQPDQWPAQSHCSPLIGMKGNLYARVATRIHSTRTDKLELLRCEIYGGVSSTASKQVSDSGILFINPIETMPSQSHLMGSPIVNCRLWWKPIICTLISHFSSGYLWRDSSA